MPIDVLGIGTPIVDYLIQVNDSFIKELAGNKGGTVSVDYDIFADLLQKSGNVPIVVTGGSATNTIKGLTQLGRSCALFGKRGNDEAGRQFENEMKQLGVISHILPGKLPTAQVICFVSPDSERTMRSFLGAGAEMTPEDLSLELFQGVKIVHLEGYLLDYKRLTHRAMELAKQAGALISFDISSIEIARHHKEDLLNLIAEYVDIFFANEDEALALLGKTAQESCIALKNICNTIVIKMGRQGSWAANKDSIIYQPALNVQAIDTTGAGDLFACGFLHGYLSNSDLAECSRYGSIVASEVVKIIGADIPSDTWQIIKTQLAP